MKSGHERHLFYWLAALSSFAGWILHGWIEHHKLITNSTLLPFAEIASPALIFGLLFYLFDKIGWKIGFLCWIFQVPHLPDLNGEWEVSGT